MADTFDRAMALLGVPDVRASRPATIQAKNALLGHSGTHIIQTAFHPEDGWTAFIQIIDAGTSQVTQVVIPNPVCKALYRQLKSTAARPKRRLTEDELRRKKVREARELLKAESARRRAQ